MSQVTRAAAAVSIGVVWALLPCRLLYSALLVAVMSNGVGEGAVVMALFAAGSGVLLLEVVFCCWQARGYGYGCAAMPQAD